MLALFGRSPQQIWAGNAFAVGPLNPYATVLALHFADQAITLNRAAAEVTAVRCTTRPDTLADWQRLIPLTKHSAPEVRGKVFCRTSRYDEAVKLLEPLCKVTKWDQDFGPMEVGFVPVTTPAPMFLLYLALAERGRGRTAQASRLLKEATDWLNASPKDKPRQTNRDRLPWTERVQIDELRRELEMLLKEKAR
jgi:hypothetical protein